MNMERKKLVPLNRSMLLREKGSTETRFPRTRPATGKTYRWRASGNILTGPYYVVRQIGALKERPRLEFLRDQTGEVMSYTQEVDATHTAKQLNLQTPRIQVSTN